VDFVVLILAAAVVVVAVVFGALLRWQQRAYTRERHLLVNQLLHATGRTWQPPPAAEKWGDELEEIEAREWPEWTATPEQHPVCTR
jgi:hypothetical protein